jgi:hypothetical protein
LALTEKQITSHPLGDLSDGFHTINELREHSQALLYAVISQDPNIAWHASAYEDIDPGCFIVGANLSTGLVVCHIDSDSIQRFDPLLKNRYSVAPLPCPYEHGIEFFDDLYDQRHALMAELMRLNPSISWRSLYHEDGSMLDGRVIVGMNLPTGSITYHAPSEKWSMYDLPGVVTLDFAPAWDGHSSNDALFRLKQWKSEI